MKRFALGLSQLRVDWRRPVAIPASLHERGSNGGSMNLRLDLQASVTLGGQRLLHVRWVRVQASSRKFIGPLDQGRTKSHVSLSWKSERPGRGVVPGRSGTRRVRTDGGARLESSTRSQVPGPSMKWISNQTEGARVLSADALRGGGKSEVFDEDINKAEAVRRIDELKSERDLA